MNFGSGFLSILKAIYEQSTEKLKINHTFLDTFTIYRGTRQGCPLTPLLFAMAIEPLANQIRRTPEIQGIKIGEVMHKLACSLMMP